MAIRLIYGEHGNDLIDECLEKISVEARTWPQKRAFLLVPEQTKADMERRFLRALQKKRELSGGAALPETLMLLDVVSFSRFAHRILSEIGAINEDYIDASLEGMLIHSILRENRTDFRCLSALADRIGYVPEIQNVLGDFSRYRVTPTTLRSIEKDDTEPRFISKMQDFALLMERLEARIEEIGFARSNDNLARLTKTLQSLIGTGKFAWPLDRLSYLRDTSIWIVGFGQFRDFTPEEAAVIDSLSLIAENLTITVTADALPASEADVALGSSAFRFGRQTLLHLRERYSDAICEASSACTVRPRELSALTKYFAARSGPVFCDGAEAIRAGYFKNNLDELRFVAGEIRRLTLTEGYRYRDIGIVLCDPPKYEPNLHAVFAEYGLDPFLDKRRPLSQTAFIRFVMSLLDLGVSGWAYRPMMACLKSGICHIPPEEVDEFENFCLKYGFFRGYRLFDFTRFHTGNDPFGKMRAIVERVLVPLRAIVSDLQGISSCAGKSAALMRFFISYGGTSHGYLPGIAGQIEALSTEWADAGDRDAASSLTASYNVLVALLQKLTGPVGNGSISLANYKGMLAAGMDATMYGNIPSYMDQISISDVRRGAMRTCKILFLVGASAEAFPFHSVKEGYLRGFEREWIEKAIGRPFPSRARDQYYADYAAAYALLDAPSDKLYLLCPQTAEPSVIFSQIKEQFPEIRILDTEITSEHDPRLFSPTALNRYVMSVMNDKSDAERNLRIRTIVKLFPNLRPAAKITSDTYRPIPRELMIKRYPGELRMSVSQIETYAHCPFQHFGGYVLRLQKREEYEARTNIAGSILHAVLESALKEYVDSLNQAGSAEDVKEVSRRYASADYDRWAKELTVKAVIESTEPVAGDPAFRASAGHLMTLTAAHSLRTIFRDLSGETYIPEHMEWHFDGKETGCVIRTEDGHDVILQGTIDRVDTDPAGGRFRVIDYKSGEKKVRYEELYHGLSVQLPVYMKAFGNSRPDLRPASSGYFRLLRPLIDVTEKINGMDAETIDATVAKGYAVREINIEEKDLPLAAEFAIKKVRGLCNRLFAGEFPVRPRVLPQKNAKPACEYCDYISVCGIDPKHPPVMRLSELPSCEKENGKKQSAKERYADVLLQMHNEEVFGHET